MHDLKKLWSRHYVLQKMKMLSCWVTSSSSLKQFGKKLSGKPVRLWRSFQGNCFLFFCGFHFSCRIRSEIREQFLGVEELWQDRKWLPGLQRPRSFSSSAIWQLRRHLPLPSRNQPTALRWATSFCDQLKKNQLDQDFKCRCFSESVLRSLVLELIVTLIYEVLDLLRLFAK